MRTIAFAAADKVAMNEARVPSSKQLIAEMAWIRRLARSPVTSSRRTAVVLACGFSYHGRVT